VLSSNTCSHPTKLSVATLNPIKKKLEKNPTLTARQLKMRMTQAQWKKKSGHPSKLSVATLDLMKKKLKKNPTLTASQMKMRMRMEEATSLYTHMMNQLLFKRKKMLCFYFFAPRSQFLQR
jgi:uncharacterized protein YneF (UPF0154 family)